MPLLLNGTSEYGQTPAPVTGFPVTIACRVKVDSVLEEKGCPFSLTDQTANNLRSQLRLTTNGELAWAVKGVISQQGAFGTYQANVWNTIVCVAEGERLRHLWYNGTKITYTDDTGAFAGITQYLIGARYDSAGTTPELFFDGEIEQVVVANVAWDAAMESAYRLGTNEAHEIPGAGVQFYRNFLHNTTAPGPGGAVTVVGTPTYTTSSQAYTGLGAKRVTIAGTQADIRATLATFRYEPDLGYQGPETLSMVSRDAGGMTDSDTTPLTVSALSGPGDMQLHAQSGSDVTLQAAVAHALVLHGQSTSAVVFRVANDVTGVQHHFAIVGQSRSRASVVCVTVPPVSVPTHFLRSRVRVFSTSTAAPL